MKITIPELSMVVLIGTSGSGKSSFARKHFKPTEVLSSDYCRALVSDDENNLAATKEAFEVLHFIAGKRLAAGKLTVVDATNVQPESRAPFVTIARQYHCLPVAIVLDLPERLCQDRNKGRSDRDFGPHVIHQQNQQLRRHLKRLEREGFRHVFILSSPEEVDAVTIERQPLWCDLKKETGPFDIIGDVHGCFDELCGLLGKMGYEVREDNGAEDGLTYKVQPPAGRKAVFLGDLVDRGPRTPDVLRLVMRMEKDGAALCVPGNHDIKLMRKLKGRDVKISHGLAESLEQLERETPAFRQRVAAFLDDLVSHYVLDGGRLVVAHAGMKQEMQGRGSGKVREFALYGETTGEVDEYGLPVRYNWAAEYRGKAMVVYGHTPVPNTEWLNNTICLDTGCVFGGKLTALRYPEKELISVDAAKMYYAPVKPLVPEKSSSPLSVQQELDDLLSIEDVTGKRIVQTRLQRNITVREENAVTALEVMSRYAVHPKWLIYLPPTMSPPETSSKPGLLEHPEDIFSHYTKQGVQKVVCEEKHMGSRAVLIVCRDEASAVRRFGVQNDGAGVCYTRTGRRFFEDKKFEESLLNRASVALTKAGLWEELGTDWVCLDTELMPWSLKAQELLKDQYAAVGSAAQGSLPEAVASLKAAASRGIELGELTGKYVERESMIKKFVAAYQGYCWPVKTLTDIKLAPFHLLASEGKVHVDRPHTWHMDFSRRLHEADPELFKATPYKIVDLSNPESQNEAVQWWKDLTGGGGEGMVVKPFDFIPQNHRGLVQPAMKCRGPEYLRIIYGPEYMAPENMERLRGRAVQAKRSLALREFALGIEGLERFVRKEPLRQVHECVFGVLALESEPVDPRL